METRHETEHRTEHQTEHQTEHGHVAKCANMEHLTSQRGAQTLLLAVMAVRESARALIVAVMRGMHEVVDDVMFSLSIAIRFLHP